MHTESAAWEYLALICTVLLLELLTYFQTRRTGDMGVVIVESDPGADADTVDWEYDWWDLVIGFTSGSNPATLHTNATVFVEVSGIRDWAIKCIVQVSMHA